MRKTTKMFVARNAMKRDSRGRFTSEGGGVSRMGGDYRMDGNGGSSMNGSYRMEGGTNGGSMRMREANNMGKRGGYRMADEYGNGDMYGDNRTRAGAPMPNYNIPEGRDMEHGEKRTSGRYYDMDDDEPRIGFREWPKMGAAHDHGNVVSMQRGHSSTRHEHKPEKLTDELAEKWVQSMKNEDGSKGPHWTREQTQRLMKHMGIQDDIEPREFYAVINAMYSDYCAVAKKYGVDDTEFYGELAKAWLQDEDAVEDKAAAYYCYVVKH